MGIQLRAIVVATAIAVLGAACGGGPGSPTTPPTTTTNPTTTASPTTTSLAPSEVVIGLPTVSAMDDAWQLAFLIPYGAAEDQLGTAPGGDGGSLNLGPDYGAQAADGTWWILDKAKSRFAHYSATGEYLDSRAFDPAYLVNGRFPFQLLRGLGDGSLVASQLGSEEGSRIFRMAADGAFNVVRTPAFFSLKTDDAENLYGFGRDNAPMSADPITGELTSIGHFLTQAGTRFRVTVNGGGMEIETPDATTNYREVRFVLAEDPSVPAFAGVELASGSDGSLFILVYGGTDSGAGGQLGGFLMVTPDGQLSALESIQDPFSPSDPGSPAHLGVRAGTDVPWLMFVDTDGLRVFTRTA